MALRYGFLQEEGVPVLLPEFSRLSTWRYITIPITTYTDNRLWYVPPNAIFVKANLAVFRVIILYPPRRIILITQAREVKLPLLGDTEIRKSPKLSRDWDSRGG